MATYTNLLNYSSQAAGSTCILFQKTDFVLSDLQVGGVSWLSPAGVMTSTEQASKPFDVTGYSKVIIIANFGAMTGTSPSVTFKAYLYDDPTGVIFYDGLSVGANFAGGAQSYLQLGGAGNATLSNGTAYNNTPLWIRLGFINSAVTGISATNRITIVGVR